MSSSTWLTHAFGNQSSLYGGENSLWWSICVQSLVGIQERCILVLCVWSTSYLLGCTSKIHKFPHRTSLVVKLVVLVFKQGKLLVWTAVKEDLLTRNTEFFPLSLKIYRIVWLLELLTIFSKEIMSNPLPFCLKPCETNLTIITKFQM